MYIGIIFYQDGIQMLERALKSARRTGAHVISIDGRFKEFPGTSFASDDEHIRIARWYSNEFIKAKQWKDQIEKRNVFFDKILDYGMTLDADEEIISFDFKTVLTQPMYTVDIEDAFGFKEPHVRIYKRGIRLTTKHYVSKPEMINGIFVSPRTETIIKHYKQERLTDRQIDKEQYYNTRKEGR